MKSLLISLICLLIPPLVFAQSAYMEHYKKAKNKYELEDYAGYLIEMKKADSLRPNHQIIMYNLAGAYALNDYPKEAFHYLHRAIMIKGDLPFEEDKDFESIKGQEEFKELIEEKEKLLRPVSRSETAFEIPAFDTHIESIAYNASVNSFYFGSINKREILKYDSNGEITTFKKQGQDGLMAVFGMAVDLPNHLLWVTTSALPEMEGYRVKDKGRAAVYAYSLSSGKLIQQFDAPEGEHLFGDLLVTNKGIFVSDSFSNEIFLVGNEEMNVWFESDEFLNIQGIAISNDNNNLYVADYVRGLFSIEIPTKKIVPVKSESSEFSLKGIDGLIYYNNSLIAIQNGTTPNKVIRCFLNDEGDSITRYEILESNNPAFAEPSLGVLVNDWLYYVANSQWPLYNDEGKFYNENKQPIKILKVGLK